MNFDRNSEEFEQLIAIPLSDIIEQRDPLMKYVVDPALAKAKGIAGGALKTATDFYTAPVKAAYGATSGALKTAGSKVASAVGASPATAGKIGAMAGSPMGVGAATGVAAAGAAAVVYAGYKIYKRYMTDVGKACAKAPNKKMCELQFHIRAKKAQVQGMTDAMGHHCKTRDCYMSVDIQINKLKREIDGLQAKLDKIPRQPQPDNPERREDEVFKGHHPAVK